MHMSLFFFSMKGEDEPVQFRRVWLYQLLLSWSLRLTLILLLPTLILSLS